MVIPEVGTPNGMGFTPDGKSLYFTDTHTHKIERFAYDRASGAIADPQPSPTSPLRRRGRPGRDDGGRRRQRLVGALDGSCLVQYRPDGTEFRRIAFPVRKVSSVTFGGDDYADMYVTTAGGQLRPGDGAYAGALYRLRLDGVRGVPEFRSRIRL